MKEMRSSLLLRRWLSTGKGLFSSKGIYIPPELPVLNTLARELKQTEAIDFSKTAIVGVQHLLPTTASLFDVLINIFGMNPGNLFIKGKCYSTVPVVEQYMRERGIQITRSKNLRTPGQYQEMTREEIQEMWEQFETHLSNSPNIEKIIVLDDGGMCLETVPKKLRYKYELAGIEQTRFGLYSKTVQALVFPLIDVARSAAKKNLESVLIGDAVSKRLGTILPDLNVTPDTVFGVVGNGAIGSALAKYLLAQGYQVITYDESENAFHGIVNTRCIRMDKLENLIAGCDIVFGCTGRDITKNFDITPFINGKSVFVSCSSQDIEFLTLLKKIGRGLYNERTSNNLTFTSHVNGNQEIVVVEKGIAVNFDRTPECDPPKDMVLTRTLLLIALIQAHQLAKKPINDGRTPNKSLHCKLDPRGQQKTVQLWRKQQPAGRFTQEELDCFNDLSWVSNNSSGELISKKPLPSLAKKMTSTENLRSIDFFIPEVEPQVENDKEVHIVSRLSAGRD